MTDEGDSVSGTRPPLRFPATPAGCTALREHLKRGKPGRVVISADPSVLHRRVMEVMDDIKTAGIQGIAFEVRGTAAKATAPGARGDFPRSFGPLVLNESAVFCAFWSRRTRWALWI